jgi:hypothetical protein
MGNCLQCLSGKEDFDVTDRRINLPSERTLCRECRQQVVRPFGISAKTFGCHLFSPLSSDLRPQPTEERSRAREIQGAANDILEEVYDESRYGEARLEGLLRRLRSLSDNWLMRIERQS